MSKSNDPHSIEVDLIWFFCNADADCGFSSNYNAMINATSDATWTDPYTDGRLRQVTRRRRIEKRLSFLEPLHRRALFALFGPHGVSPPIREVLGHQLAPLALCCMPAEVEDINALCSRMLRGSASKEDTATINKIRIDALDLKTEAMGAYAKTKRHV